ncbi:hypothetical protein A1O3_00410 [Capronia epimyces CBS 606.96]|uniref:Uncharacterized protein n=1 Tax=Capronia epimyces CBS 606.96 TaxID=1182542 RepID=W9YQE9_9EURO|nr:uncharacterized protein A1O3_00410 [Capronia epimyces CBS 606.96]EXJ91860.1 hypothetical protein A1O3_00410 [Capronia epimyces CBS 606.96]
MASPPDHTLLLTRTWLTSKTDKWPDHLTAALQTLMLEKHFFAVQRLNVESTAKLFDILQTLKPYFAIADWDPGTERLLLDKVENKIRRIRSTLLSRQLIVRGPDGYAVPNNDDDNAEKREKKHDELFKVYEKLSCEDQKSVLLRSLSMASYEIVTEFLDASVDRMRALSPKFAS